MNVLQRIAATGLIARRDSELPDDGRMYRDLSFEVRAVNEETRTVELSFSSETPVERWWGNEILDHGATAVRLGRLNDGAALLMDHNSRDQVGVVERAWLDGRRGRATVRFGRSARAEEVFQDVKDGIRKLVSVGYRILSIVLESATNGDETYRITDWEPFEISLVAIPADASVGVDRDAETPAFDPRSLIPSEEEDMRNMYQRRNTEPAPSPVAAPAAPAVPAAPANLAVDRAAILAAERTRTASIRSLAARLGCADLGDEAVTDGRSLEAFIEAYNARSTPQQQVRPAESPIIGLGDREIQRFSFMRAINAMANPTDRRAQEAAAFEFECSAAAAEALGRESRGITIPLDVVRAPLEGQRDLVVGTATAGGNLVQTDLAGAAFIDLLRNALAIEQMGSTMLTDLNGNLAIPRMTGGATAYWVAENAAPSESQQAFDQVSLTPKTVGAFTDIGRRLMLQSSIDVEALVRRDLALVLALAIDLAAVNGSGSSNQPRGILNTSGIGSVAGGTNGLAPTYAHIVNLETAVANVTAAVGSLGYLTNTKVRGLLKQTQKFASTNGDPVWEKGDELNGYKAGVSNQVPSNLTKGSSSGICSAIIYGNWLDLLIGMWGGLDLLVDPYTGGTAGTVRVSVLQDVDIAVRHPESFSAMLDALA